MNRLVITMMCSLIVVFTVSFSFISKHGYAESNNEEIVEFGNTGLQESIKLELGIDKNQNITIADMQKLNHLVLSDVRVTSLNGLEHATNLKTLSVMSGNLKDIAAIANLSSLEELYLESNHIRDISPLSKLSALRVLYIGNNGISDITPLAQLKNLEELSLESNEIANIGVLKNLLLLKKLHLGTNKIKDITPISKLTSITNLTISHNSIREIDALKNMKALESVDLSETELSDISVLKKMKSLREVFAYGIKDYETMEWLDNQAIEFHHDWHVIFQERALEDAVKSELEIHDRYQSVSVFDIRKLEYLNVRGHGLKTLEGLEEATNLKTLSIDNNEIRDISILEKLTGLEWISLYGNKTGNQKLVQALISRGVTVLYNEDEVTQVKFEDKQLEENIKNTLGFRDEVKLTVADMYMLDHLDFSYAYLYNSLIGLEHAKNLTHLDVRGNNINDISMLKNLKSLKYLNLVDNPMTETKVIKQLLDRGVKVDYTLDEVEHQEVSFNTIKEEDPTRYVDEEVVTQKGVKGERTINYRIYFENGKEIERSIVKEEVTKEPVDHVIKIGTKLLTLSIGDRHRDVSELKDKLSVAGFFVADKEEEWELFDKNTENTVKKFQKYYGLKIDGVVDKATESKLNEVLNSPLRNGARGELVIQLKLDLAEVGFPVRGSYEEYFDFNTHRQVIEFQKKYKLVQNGIVDEVTLKKLKELVNTELSLGVRHYKVTLLKRNLAKIGFRVSRRNTELFGEQTEARVKEFQKYFGLTVSGVANDKTLTKLEEIVSTPFQNGKRHKDIIQLKKDLAKVGFKVRGNTTNYYGGNTAARVSSFQKKYGLVQSGIADEVTLAKLKEVVNITLSNGVRHEDVVQLKKDLEKAGFKVPGKNTNLYGKQTETKVKAFQKYYGLSVNGTVDNATKEKLKEVVDSPLQSGKRHKNTIQLKKDLAKAGFKVPGNNTNLYGKKTVAKVKAFQKKYKLVQNGIADEVTLAKLKVVVNTTLSNGVRHKDVVQLKKDLEKAGFKVPGKNTNLYGKQTETKVKAFQKYYGLSVSGTVDNATKEKLKEVVDSPLQSGKRHKNTIQLKKDLAKAGFKVPGNNTNLYGKKTVAKVKAFQKKYKLIQNGIADEVTLKKLRLIVSKK